MELKNVDLVALNKVAMIIQEDASLGYNLIKIVLEKDEIDNAEYTLKNLGYIVNKRKIKSIPTGPDYFMVEIGFAKPQQGPYIFSPINILTAVEAKQLSEQNKANRQVVYNISNSLEKGIKETLIYNVDEINLNNSLLEFFKMGHFKVFQYGDKVMVLH